MPSGRSRWLSAVEPQASTASSYTPSVDSWRSLTATLSVYGWLWPGPSSFSAYCGLSRSTPSRPIGLVRLETSARSLRVVSGLPSQGLRTAAWADFSTDLPALVTCPVIVTVPFGTATGLFTVSMVITTGYSAETAVSAAGRAPPAGSAPAGTAGTSASAAPSAAANRRTVRAARRPGPRPSAALPVRSAARPGCPSASRPECRAGSPTRFALAVLDCSLLDAVLLRMPRRPEGPAVDQW